MLFKYTLLPSTLWPPTFTVTSFFGLISFSGLVTVLVLSRLSFVTCVAVFSTVWPSLTLVTVIGMTTW